MSLRAVVLLAGSVRASELGRSVGRSLLDLPLSRTETVLSLWQRQVESLAVKLGNAPLPVRVVLSRSGPAPTLVAHENRATEISIEQDRSEFRGTGGVLRDLVEPYNASDLILVANAAQVMTEPLESLAADLLVGDGDVSVIAHDDGTPSGVSVIRVGVLESVREGGFVDFKEQFLPQLVAAGKSIRVVRRARATGVPVRTLDGYLAGVRAHTRLLEGRPMTNDPFEEDWTPTFALVEADAHVPANATVHDSVVLKGGSVGAGAVVVRSVVCPGSRVSAGATVADQIVGARGRERKAERV
jgi:mannose-1-phosphate guanylyltransferase